MSQEPRLYGVVPIAEALELSGLEFLRRVRDGRLPAPPICQALPFELVAVEEGFVAFEGEPDFSVYNPLGIVHGGYAMTLVDSALGCAIHSTLPAGSRFTTLETKVNFTRAITAETGRVRAEGRIVHVGRRTGLATGEIKDAAGRVLAFGASTCLILPAEG